MDIKTWNALHSAIDKLAKIEDDQIYCHYAPPAAFVSIFDSYIRTHEYKPITECTMRASHIRFLNDSKEYFDGLNWLRTLLNKEKFHPDSLSDDIYSISFCGNEDLLSQWKWYGKNSGIAITFDMSNIQYKYYDVEEGLPDVDTHTKPLPVKYSNGEKKAYFDEINSQCRELHLNQKSMPFRSNLFIPFCKDEGFVEEKESRLIFYNVDGRSAGIKPFDIRYVPSGNALKPTLQVTFRAIDESKGIIKRLTVGPGQDQELVYHALIHIMGGALPSSESGKPEQADGKLVLNGVEIRKSRIPFRG